MVGLAKDDPALLGHFGEPRGPEPLRDGETATEAGLVPAWLQPELSPLVGEDEWPALLERAPLDLRVNVARTSRDVMLREFEGSVATPLSPWGIRLAPDTRIDDHPAFDAGLVEVQDEGSQLIALACTPAPDDRIVDLCAGAGGKSLALAAAAPAAVILATDSNRARLSKLPPRAERAGAVIERNAVVGQLLSNAARRKQAVGDIGRQRRAGAFDIENLGREIALDAILGGSDPAKDVDFPGDVEVEVVELAGAA
jgi:16S rRNA (cytosine967-C5)-methyltransferase